MTKEEKKLEKLLAKVEEEEIIITSDFDVSVVVVETFRRSKGHKSKLGDHSGVNSMLLTQFCKEHNIKPKAYSLSKKKKLMETHFKYYQALRKRDNDLIDKLQNEVIKLLTT